MKNLLLYAATVLIWGSTWLVITFHLGAVDPILSVAYRFTPASLLLLAIAVLRKINLRFTARQHVFFGLQGALLFSLNYLALFGSILAFGAYLTLLGRIGADRAAYASLLFPLVALGISTLFEGYRWSLPALVGVLLVLTGNFLVLSRRRRMTLVSQAESRV